MPGSWLNPDGLYLEYGTTKAIPTTGGDFRSPGSSRTLEFNIDISTLGTSASILPIDTTFFPAGVFIDSVILEAQTAVTGITSLSVGAIQLDRSTNIADNAFADAVVLADLDGQGETKVMYGPPAAGAAGTKVGTTFGAFPAYFTAKRAGSAGTGIVKVTVRYRGLPPITQ